MSTPQRFAIERPIKLMDYRDHLDDFCGSGALLVIPEHKKLPTPSGRNLRTRLRPERAWLQEISVDFIGVGSTFTKSVPDPFLYITLVKIPPLVACTGHGTLMFPPKLSLTSPTSLMVQLLPLRRRCYSFAGNARRLLRDAGVPIQPKILGRIKGWLHTGDVATVDPEELVRLADRTKDLIKSGENGFPRSVWKVPSWAIWRCWRPQAFISLFQQGIAQLV